MRPLSLYIHVPFCTRRCPYCSFYHVHASGARERDTVEMLAREIDAAVADAGAGRVLRTVFIGGGTPTVLAAGLLDRLFDAVGSRTHAEHTREITVELNPEDVSAELLDRLAGHGVNRVSVGIQSMSPAAQERLGRCSPEVNARALRAVADRFENFSADVLLGVPGEGPADVVATLDAVLAFEPTHVSAYCLERGGDVDVATARFFETVDPESLAPHYLAACERLGHAGLTQYEVSNHARAGGECLHNLVYWSGEEYVGVGPGAHSYVAEKRFQNPPSLDAYLSRDTSRPLGGRVFDDRDDDAIRLERAMLALRTRHGLPRSACRCDDAYIAGLSDEGLLQDGSRERIVLTPRGYLVLDDILLRLDPCGDIPWT